MLNKEINRIKSEVAEIGCKMMFGCSITELLNQVLKDVESSLTGKASDCGSEG